MSDVKVTSPWVHRELIREYPKCQWRSCDRRANMVVQDDGNLWGGQDYCLGHAEAELGRRCVVAAGLEWTLPLWMRRRLL